MSQQVKRGSREYYNFKITSYSTKQCVFVSVYVRRTCKESCPSLCDPMDCNPSGSSVHGILQATVLVWIMPSSRGSSQPRDQTQVSWTAGRFFLPFERLGKPIKQIHFKYLTLYFASNHHSYENIDICMTVLLSLWSQALVHFWTACVPAWYLHVCDNLLNFTAVLWARQSCSSCHRSGKDSKTHLVPSLGAKQSPGPDSARSGSEALLRCYPCRTSPRRRWFLISFFQPLRFFLEHWGHSNSSKTQCLDWVNEKREQGDPLWLGMLKVQHLHAFNYLNQVKLW